MMMMMMMMMMMIIIILILINNDTNNDNADDESDIKIFGIYNFSLWMFCDFIERASFRKNPTTISIVQNLKTFAPKA